MKLRAATLAPLCAFLCACDAPSGLPVDAGVDGDAGPPLFQQVAMPAQVADVNWFAVHGKGSENVVFVGSGGAIARWDGQAMVVDDSGTKSDLRGVFVDATDKAWAVGESGAVVRWEGGVWTAVPLGATPFLNAVWASGTAMIAVGALGAAWAVDTTTHVVATDSPDDLFSIASDGTGVFAVGTLGTIARYDGTAFHRSALAGFSKTLTAATVGRGGTYVAGLGGALYRLDGQTTAVSGVPTLFVHGVAAPGAGAWVVGFDSLVAHAAHGKVTQYTEVPSGWYEAVWGTSDEDLWVVGNAGLVLHTGPPPVIDAGVPGGKG